ncbi:MAG: hypothetical protein ACO1TE_12845 [Prosthecobacter sp.]
MSERREKRVGCLQWGVVFVVALLGCLWLSSQFTNAARTAPQMKAVSNAKQIIIALKYYAAENDGMYPDAPRPGVAPASANQVFRRLFQEGIVNDERIFGTLNSVLTPDGEIGSAPAFDRALMPGECPWMLLKNQADSSPADVPLIIENSVDATFPPRWNVSPDAGRKRGRAWKGGQIVIGHNDGSVEVKNLRSDGTLRGERASDGYRPSWFEQLMPQQTAKLSYWDIEER